MPFKSNTRTPLPKPVLKLYYQMANEAFPTLKQHWLGGWGSIWMFLLTFP